MIKYLGSIGFYLRLNDGSNKDYRLFEVFTSSAATTSLFSVDINNSVGQLLYSSSGVSSYVTGVSGSAVASEKWTHITFSFDPPLSTYDTNNFLVRFGDSASCNFNIQNLYMVRQGFSPTEVQYLNQEFTGVGNRTITVEDNEVNLSLNFIDYQEEYFTSQIDGSIYQALPNHLELKHEVIVASNEDILNNFYGSTLSGDSLFFDGYQVLENDNIYQISSSIVFTLSASSTLNFESLSEGDVIRIIGGNRHSNTFYYYSASSSDYPNASISPIRKKVVTTLNYIQ